MYTHAHTLTRSRTHTRTPVSSLPTGPASAEVDVHDMSARPLPPGSFLRNVDDECWVALPRAEELVALAVGGPGEAGAGWEGQRLLRDLRARAASVREARLVVPHEGSGGTRHVEPPFADSSLGSIAIDQLACGCWHESNPMHAHMG